MKFFILIVALGLTASSGFAQRITRGDDGLDKKVLSVEVAGPTLLTLEMTRELNLTEEQQKEVQLLNEQRYQQLQQSEQGDQYYLAVQKVHLQNDKALMKVLKPEQLSRFLELEGRQNMLHLTELGND
ncbi:hypothetical protein H7F15_03540 [Pontibacter sp. Tf4]|uniref:hypothetical protein n=1 Tax=Pontibacter sp. Tf4 TaxID=2761620 RepID=UPI00162426F0|nr:hypothetical protein [Pontibacter sp. Tf4]MBB6610101.1 hypothetical protein [Pontibacter sp. Tf4]